MDLACRDISIEGMRIEVVNRKKMLVNKLIELRKTSSDNRFLGGVVEDYENYFNYIKTQKREQYDALCFLSDYIADIAQNTELTEQMLQDSKIDQKDILMKMKNVKLELDELIKQTS
jgi:hypothetical protein